MGQFAPLPWAKRWFYPSASPSDYKAEQAPSVETMQGTYRMLGEQVCGTAGNRQAFSARARFPPQITDLGLTAFLFRQLKDLFGVECGILRFELESLRATGPMPCQPAAVISNTCEH
jgi:hypothetical protein